MNVESKPSIIKTLDTFNVFEEGIIIKIDGEGKLRRRLLDMGLTPNTNVTLRKKAPLGDPIEITLRNYKLTLRKAEAKLISLKMTKLVENKEVNKWNDLP